MSALETQFGMGVASFLCRFPPSVLFVRAADGIVPARSFSEAVQPQRKMEAGNEGDFVFAQTAYKFDVGSPRFAHA